MPLTEGPVCYDFIDGSAFDMDPVENSFPESVNRGPVSPNTRRIHLLRSTEAFAYPLIFMAAQSNEAA
jgi:hypothetical protein